FKRDGKGTLSVSIEREGGPTSIKHEDKSNPAFQTKSIELGDKISFDFSLKDGLKNVKGIGIKGILPILGETTVGLSGAKLTKTKDNEPALEVRITPKEGLPAIPFTIPLKKITDT